MRYTVDHSPAGPSSTAIPAATPTASTSQPMLQAIASPRRGDRPEANRRCSTRIAATTAAAVTEARTSSTGAVGSRRSHTGALAAAADPRLADRRLAWPGMEPIRLEPVDAVRVTTLVDNVTDMLLVD